MKVEFKVRHLIIPVERGYTQEFDNIEVMRDSIERIMLGVLNLGWEPISIKVDDVEKLIKIGDSYEVILEHKE